MTLLDILLARFGLFLVPGRVARGMKPLASEVLSPRKAAQGRVVLCYGLPGGSTPSKDEPKPMGPTPEKPGRPSGPCLAVRLSPQMRRVATPCVPTKSFAALRGLKPSGWQQTLGSSDSSAHALEVKLQLMILSLRHPVSAPVAVHLEPKLRYNALYKLRLKQLSGASTWLALESMSRCCARCEYEVGAAQR